MEKFICQDEMNHDLSDPTDSMTVEAFDAESAATEFAEKWDTEGDYPFAQFDGARVKVTGEDGKVTWWKIYTEEIREYSASEDQQ